MLRKNKKEDENEGKNRERQERQMKEKRKDKKVGAVRVKECPKRRRLVGSDKRR